VGITAWEGIERANVQAGQTVLVYGGTGGVGHLALQLAKIRGAQVTATVSNDEKGRIARSLGADAVIDYRAEIPDEWVSKHTAGRGFDVVFDTVGNEHIAEAFAASRLNGQVVAINSLTTLDLTTLHLKGLSLHLVFMLIPLLHNVGRSNHGHILGELARLADAGRLRVLADKRRFGFDNAGEAHKLAEGGGAIGKVVIEIDA
jgi:NADPH:quinone reductase